MLEPPFEFIYFFLKHYAFMFFVFHAFNFF